MIKIYVKRGLDVNARTKDGRTALHYYASRRYPKQRLKILIDNGADVNSKTDEGYTPLHAAAMDNNIDAIKILIKYGADINVKSKYGETPLDKCRDSKCQLLLKKHGALNGWKC